MNIETTCCFTGNRPQKLPFGFNEKRPDCVKLKKILLMEIEESIICRNISHFISGMALGVDQFAAEIVLRLKKKYPHITLELAIPCETQAERWNEKQRERYYEIAVKCDKETMIHREYTESCMVDRNRYMVNNSGSVIAVWTGEDGGTRQTVNYALAMERKVTIINPADLSIKKYI